MMPRSLFFLINLAVCLIPLVQATQCTFCASASQRIVTGRWNYRFSDGTTCQSAYLQTTDLDSTDSACYSVKRKYQNACCNPNANVGTGSSGSSGTPMLPAYTGPVGDEPDCPVCGGSEYPGKPNQLIVARYVGEYTCGQLFARGFHGMIPDYMCGALQDYTYYACGCGIYNPVCRTDSSKCYGGANYRAPYIIPFSTQVGSSDLVFSLTSEEVNATSTSSNPGTRRLRGGAQEDQQPFSPQDFRFETREAEEEGAESVTEPIST